MTGALVLGHVVGRGQLRTLSRSARPSEELRADRGHYRRRAPNMTADQVARAKEMLAAGATLKQIVREVGGSSGTWSKRLGARRRTIHLVRTTPLASRAACGVALAGRVEASW